MAIDHRHFTEQATVVAVAFAAPWAVAPAHAQDFLFKPPTLLAAHAKTKPGKLSHGRIRVGSVYHLPMRKFMVEAGRVKLT
jgi:hypothetical protein